MLTSRQGYTKDLEIACRQIHIYIKFYISVCAYAYIWMWVSYTYMCTILWFCLLVGLLLIFFDVCPSKSTRMYVCNICVCVSQCKFWILLFFIVLLFFFTIVLGPVWIHILCVKCGVPSVAYSLVVVVLNIRSRTRTHRSEMKLNKYFNGIFLCACVCVCGFSC